MPGARGKQSGARGAAASSRAKAPASKKGAPAKRAAPTKKASPKPSAVKKPAKKAAPTRKSVAKKAAPAKKSVAKKAVAKKAPPAKVAAAVKEAPPAKVPPKKKTVTCELSGFEVMPGSPNLSPKTLERLRKKLLDEQTRLTSQADELAAEAEQLARDREGGDTQFDEESGEGDTVNVERERDLLLSASARGVVDEIDEALVRLKKGTYGVCKYAGRRLPLERLEAIPWANVCVDCKARAERRR